MKGTLLLCLWLLFATTASVTNGEGTADAHLDAVKLAYNSGAYADEQKESGCPAFHGETHGWPEQLLVECIYSQRALKRTDKPLKGYAVLVKVPPDNIKTWIEAGCASQLAKANQETCFQNVLRCGYLNSGYMFAISGNIIEDGKNVFLRNGMTVYLKAGGTFDPNPIPIDEQMRRANLPDSEIDHIPTGLTRFWRTFPRHFAALYGEDAAPKTVAKVKDRERWLDITRTEFNRALQSSDNRLLDAYLHAYAKLLSEEGAKCPNESK